VSRRGRTPLTGGNVLENGILDFQAHGGGVFDEADLVKRTKSWVSSFRAGGASLLLRSRAGRALGVLQRRDTAAALLLLDDSLLAGAALLRAILPIEPPRPPDLTGSRF